MHPMFSDEILELTEEYNYKTKYSTGEKKLKVFTFWLTSFESLL